VFRKLKKQRKLDPLKGTQNDASAQLSLRRSVFGLVYSIAKVIYESQTLLKTRQELFGVIQAEDHRRLHDNYVIMRAIDGG